MKFSLLFLIVLSFKVNAQKLFLKPGEYSNGNCFIKTKVIDGSLLHIQFAHKDYHLLKDGSYDYDQIEFNAENVLGTNIFYDLDKHHILYGPDKCNSENVINYSSTRSRNLFKIKCGGYFKEAKAVLRIHLSDEKEITSFSFYEKFNPTHQGRYSSPFRQKVIFNFLCKDLNPHVE